jgi:hypothetical protein
MAFEARDGGSQIGDDIDARTALVDRVPQGFADVGLIVNKQSCLQGRHPRPPGRAYDTHDPCRDRISHIADRAAALHDRIDNEEFHEDINRPGHHDFNCVRG